MPNRKERVPEPMNFARSPTEEKKRKGNQGQIFTPVTSG